MTPATSTADLGIREFSRQSGYSEAKVRRAMRELQIKGKFQGRGKATLLKPEEQERLALYIDEIELRGNETPDEAPEDLGDRAIPPSATPETPVPETPVEANRPLALDSETDSGEALDSENEAVLDQLWEAHQAQHLAQEPELLPIKPPITQPAASRTVVSQSALPVQPAASQPSPQLSSQPHPHPQNSPSGPLAAPSKSASYYDPYFDNHPPVAPTTRIQPGNHRQVLAPPSLPENYDLGQFRSEDNITTLADPGAIAAQAMGAIDALVQGMDADIHQQRIHLEETLRAAQTLRLKAKQLQDKKIEYMIQSSTLGQAQQQGTLEIQEALEGIQALGKSPSGEPTSP